MVTHGNNIKKHMITYNIRESWILMDLPWIFATLAGPRLRHAGEEEPEILVGHGRPGTVGCQVGPR